MGFFSGLDTERYDRQYSDRQLVNRMLAYFRPHAPRLFVVAGLLLTIALAGASVPVIVSRGVDLLEEAFSLGTAFLLAGLVLAAGFITWGANWWRRRWTIKAMGDIVMALRTDAFKAAAEHDLSFYDEFSSGRIVSRITSDTQDFGQIVILLTDLISQFVQALILAVILINIDLRLSLYLFSFIPILLLSTLGFRRIARAVTRKGMRAMANVNAAIKETVSGIAVAKNFRQEPSIYDEFQDANLTSYKVNVQRGFILAMVFPSLNALGGIATAILVYTGGISTARGLVSFGAWFLFLQSLERFFFPVLNLSAFWTQVQSGLSAAERVFALIDAEHAVVQRNKLSVPKLEGEIKFEKVCFQYSDKETVLQDFNLQIKPGENLALVGHTGAGKSSIAKLIARFYEFQQGRVSIDGYDIRSFDLSEYRKHLGIVSQTPFLFAGTVLENICYGCDVKADRTQVEELAYQIGEGDWLDTLPVGLDTEVGERGTRLSMGQRQLVSLMRVLVQRPTLFILDEATASVDPFTEWQIQQALNMILEKTTSILIAHRLSTVKAADRIIVLEKGRIIEEGNHESLLDRQGHYSDLYNTYFRHQSIDYRPPGLEEYLELKQQMRYDEP
jgi:ATP-binding cassette, subfamily B, bacterial